jgi:hypothetical protein
MNALINTKNYESNTFMTAIQKATPEQVDALWSILKYKEIGIFRKIKSMSVVLNLNFNEIFETLPKDEKGRVIDRKTRHLIHDVLIDVS